MLVANRIHQTQRNTAPSAILTIPEAKSPINHQSPAALAKIHMLTQLVRPSQLCAAGFRGFSQASGYGLVPRLSATLHLRPDRPRFSVPHAV